MNDSLMQVRFNGTIFCFYLVCYLYAKNSKCSRLHLKKILDVCQFVFLILG